MGDLRLKAQKIIKIKNDNKEYNTENKYEIEKKNMNYTKKESKRKFIEKIQKEIDNFQNNLLKSANKGEPLKIEILRLDTDGLLSWWDEREDRLVNTIYTPIKSEVVTFIDDINLKNLTDDIILDETLLKLYNLIKENDIYPEWKVSKNNIGEIEFLYLEANPNFSYQERKKDIDREKQISQRALVAQNYRQNISDRENTGLDKIKNFLLIFLPTLYFSVMILTILSRAIGLVEVPQDSILSSFVDIGWPYFLVSEFSEVGELFLFSLPLGFLISLYFAYKKS
jgi:hypothetical protein